MGELQAFCAAWVAAGVCTLAIAALWSWCEDLIDWLDE